MERFLWTVAQAGGGALLDQLTSGEVSWRAVGYAAAIVALKLVIAHNVGSSTSGALPETKPPGTVNG
jgi:hypothetical protein